MSQREFVVELFDDRRAREWSPFAETRPVGELRFGALRLRERIETWAAAPCLAHRAGSHLVDWEEAGAPPGVDGALALPSGTRGRLLWLSRAVPRAPFDALGDLGGEPATFEDAHGVVGWWLPEGTKAPDDDALQSPETFTPGRAVPVQVLRLNWPWQLVEHNAEQLALDVAELAASSPGFVAPEGVWVEGRHGVVLEPGAEIGPGVVLDTREGPIHLAAGVRVDGPGRLSGPLSLGAGTHVFGGSLARLSAGPQCKLRGEIADTVITGFCNKAHEGYLGHALLGCWVNLGAGTTNSDLKNNYGEVRVQLRDALQDTGLAKVGVFLGDHVKTSIGTLLTTGAVVGAGSNVFGSAGLSARWLPPFTWGDGSSGVHHDWSAFVATARRAMGRRDQELRPGMETVLQRLWSHHAGAP
jgi:UDP-N-acetylglucosamine diphosphorylase/glucosamine-1-phosphate N-acetyltransferase